MKAKQILAALSAVVIAAVSFSGCAVEDIFHAIRNSATPHIEKDSIYIKEFEENKAFFYEQNISYKPDKAAKSKIDSFTEKLKKSDYTLREYRYLPGYGDYLHYENYLEPLVNDSDKVTFEEYVCSGEDYKNIYGDYLVKNGKPIIDKKTTFGAYGEKIYVDGRLYLRYVSANFFLEDIDDPDIASKNSELYYISLLNTVDAGTLTIGGKKYDAERLNDIEEDNSYLNDIEEYNSDGALQDIIYGIGYDYDNNHEYIVAYDENGNVFAILVYIEGEIYARVAVIYEQNEDNSDKIKAPNQDQIG